MAERTQVDRESAVRAVQALMESDGLSLRAACAACGVSPANLLRWQAALSAPEPAVKNPGGRPRTWHLDAGDRQRLRWLMAACDSLPLAVEYFCEWADMGVCPLPVSDYCQRRCAALSTAPDAAGLAARLQALRVKNPGRRWDALIPRVIRQACALTKLERAELRGPRAQNDEGFKRQRLMAIRVLNEEGAPEVIKLLAGMGFCSDDMSINEPFVTPQGMNRQTLCTHDIYSRKWLNLYEVGRRGDAYTLVDIANMFSSVIAAVGLPYYWVLERGPWENDFVNGCAVPPAWCDEQGRRWGALSSLFRISRKFLPQGKTIEGAFDYLQSRMAGRSTSVGRVRGGHEAVSRLLQRAKDGDAASARMFWGAHEAAEAIWGQMMADNAKPKRRAFLGDVPAVPDALWRASYQRRALAASDEWLLHPVKVCRVTRAQSVYVRLDGYGELPLQFRMCGTDLPWRAVDNGFRVAVALHPDHPERGATVACMETRSAYNRDGIRLGQVMGVAPYVPPVVMEDFTGDAIDATHQRRARAAVRQEIRAGGMDAAGLVRVSRAADGLNAAITISNQPDAAAGPAAPARGRRAARSLAALRMAHAETPLSTPKPPQ